MLTCIWRVCAPVHDVWCIQGGVYYAVPSSVPGVQHIVYSLPVDSAAELLHGISDQPSTVVHVRSVVKLFIYVDMRVTRECRHIDSLIGSRPSDHYFRSVCLSVCVFVCLFVQSFSQLSLIRFRSN